MAVVHVEQGQPVAAGDLLVEFDHEELDAQIALAEANLRVGQSRLDQTSMLSTFDSIFDALEVMLLGIASISLLVGGIGIMNIMLVSVRERTREVGIRKAVGATRRDIGIQFVIESMTVSAIGGLIGIGLGFFGALSLRVVYPAFPVYTSSWAVLMAFGFSLCVGVFFGAYPAIKAAGVDPVEALRYE